MIRDLRSLHDTGKRLDGLFVLGTRGELPGGGYPAARDLVDTLLLECMSHAPDSTPVVLAAPGVGDRRTDGAAGRRLVRRALTDMWDGYAEEFWRGDLDDEVAQPLRTDVFGGFEEWNNRVGQAGSGAHTGVLAGDRSSSIDLEGRRIGLVTVNTVFRMVAEGAPVTLAGCYDKQLTSAVGADFSAWTEDKALTFLLAGHTGSLPDLSAVPTPVLALAGEGEAGRGWQVVSRSPGQAHRLLRVDLRDHGLEVVDVESRRPLSLMSSGSSASESAPAPRVSGGAREEAGQAELLQSFYQQAATGRMVLAVVSGPEADSAALGTDELNERLARLVYGSAPTPLPSLMETWDAAREELPAGQLEQQVKALQCPPDANPRAAHRLLKSPWWRVYDFTGSDTFAVAVGRDPQLADTVALINGVQEVPGKKKNVIEVVSMNGTVGEAGGIDFGTVPAEDSDPRNLWRRQFQTELLTRPVLFMALSPDSPGLWDTLALTDRHFGAGGGYPGFIVTPEGSDANRSRLRRASLGHITETPFDFATGRLNPGHGDLIEGMRSLSQSHAGERRGTGAVHVASLVGDAPKRGRAFLEGSDPTWGDVVHHVAADLSMVEALERAAQRPETGRAPIVLLQGSAGSGKTTALMQCAYRFHMRGEKVCWVDRDASVPRRTIEDQILEQKVGAVFVDDVDMFGSQAATMLKTLNRGGETVVIAAIRATRVSVLDATFDPTVVRSDEPLTDPDLKNLIKALKNQGLLGELKKHRLPHQRLNAMRAICERGLLAAMIKVVTGKDFEDKVRSEFQQLGNEERAAYSTVCLFESALVYKQRGIDEEDLLLIIAGGRAPTRGLREAVSRLVSMGILVRSGDGRIRCRQRAIADSVVDSVLRNNVDQLSSVVKYLLAFYAARARNIQDNDHPQRRAMIKLLSHSLMNDLKLPAPVVRDIYDRVLHSLQDDRHYWLQRGQFELEKGELGIARNHLQTAKGCDGGEQDAFVRTASSAIDLKAATKAPRRPDLEKAAVNAVQELYAVTRERGGDAPHSYTILAREGSRWLEACAETLDAQTFLDKQTLILQIIAEGKKFCRGNRQFLSVADTYEPFLKKLQPKGPGVPL
ncbi:ATP-binding protein [Streptomyces sp. NPDC005374]|uniref:ATP-binding protein n=1 Tax=Streptomyces sp. NPDC005374 TaxID=3364713 RepID=UPI003697FEDF